MMTFVAVLHIFVALLLIGLVLVQDSKGGGALGIGGGGSNSLLGATGAQTLWAKLTRLVAFIFALTCVSLTYFTAERTRSLIDSAPITAPVSAPVSTAPPAAPSSEFSQQTGEASTPTTAPTPEKKAEEKPATK